MCALATNTIERREVFTFPANGGVAYRSHAGYLSSGGLKPLLASRSEWASPFIAPTHPALYGGIFRSALVSIFMPRKYTPQHELYSWLKIGGGLVYLSRGGATVCVAR